MPIGPGRYDKLAEYCLEQSHARAVALIVFDGDKGHGMSVSIPVWEIAGGLEDILRMPAILRAMADSIEKDARAV